LLAGRVPVPRDALRVFAAAGVSVISLTILYHLNELDCSSGIHVHNPGKPYEGAAKDNCRSAGSIFGRSLRGDCNDHGAETQGAGPGGILGPFAALADSRQLCPELPLYRHNLDQSPLSLAIRRPSNPGIDLD